MPSDNVANLNFGAEAACDQIRALFNLKKNYHAIRNLAQRLASLVPVGVETGLVPRRFWSSLEVDLADLDRFLMSQGLLLSSANNKWGNPNYPGLTEFPLVSALMQSVPEVISSQYLGVCIFLLYHQHQDAGEKSTIYALSARIRIAATKDFSRKIFEVLPDPALDPEGYPRSFRLCLNQVRRQYVPDSDEGELIADLVKLSQVKIVTANRQSIPASPKPLLFSQSFASPVFGAAELDLPIFSKGVGQEVSEDFHEDDITTNEAPDFVYAYQEEFDLNRENIPELAFTEIARQAGYWVDKTNQLSAINRSVMNPLEINRLVSYMSRSLEDDSFDEAVLSAIIALSFSTGLGVSRIIRASIGDNSNPKSVFSLEGDYFRTVWGPLDSGQNVGGRETNELISNLDSRLGLQLPSPIKRWFEASQSRLRFRSNLGEATGLSEEQTVKAIKSRIERLRDNGRYHITLPRIEAALPTSITIEYRNQVITTLLAGSVTQSAPMLMHYQCVSFNELRGIYQRVTDRLFLISH